MWAVADEKDSATLELVGYLLVRLRRRDFDDLEVDLLTDRLGQHLAAIWRRELCRCLPLAGEVGGDEHAEVVLDYQEYAVHVGVFDLHAIAIAQVRDELPPGCAEVDEDDIDRQRPVS